MLEGIGSFFTDNPYTSIGAAAGPSWAIGGSYLDAFKGNKKARENYQTQVNEAISRGLQRGEEENRAIYGDAFREQSAQGIQDLIARRKAELDKKDPASTMARMTGTRRAGRAVADASQRGQRVRQGTLDSIKRQGDIEGQALQHRQQQSSMANYQSLLNSIIKGADYRKFGYANLEAAPLQAPLPRKGGISGIFDALV